MSKYVNDQYFKTGSSKKVKVTAVIEVDKDASDETIMENAADALKFYMTNGYHKVWTKFLEVENDYSV